MKSYMTNQQTPLFNPLSRTIPTRPANTRYTNKFGNANKKGESYEIKISLETVHYTGNDYGYGWTFVISTLQRHWISNRIQILRGKKSIVNKDIYHNIIETGFNSLQHLPITICAQHTSGFNTETTFRLHPNSFKKMITPKSIYTEVNKEDSGFKFHELHTFTQDETQFMFVLKFEITPNGTPGYNN